MVANDLLNATAGNLTQQAKECGLIFEEKWIGLHWMGDLLCWLKDQVDQIIGLQYVVGAILLLIVLWVIKKLIIDK